MKNILIFFFLCLVNLSYSQEASITFESPKTYSFLHEKLMDDNRTERYSSRMVSECVELESISFDGNRVVLIMKEDISDETFHKAMIYCISKFGFATYKITEL